MGSVFGTIEGDLADVVHDAEELPDHTHILAAPVVDSVESFGVPDVGEDGFYGAHSVAISFFRFRGVHFVSHRLAVGVGAFDAETEGAAFSSFVQATFAKFTGVAGVTLDAILAVDSAGITAAVGVKGESFPIGTSVAVVFFVVVEVVTFESLVLLGAGLFDVFLSSFVSFVPVAVVGVGDDGVDFKFVDCGEVGLAVVVGISEELLVLEGLVTHAGSLGNGLGFFKEGTENPSVLAALGDGGGDDDLGGAIGKGLRVVALGGSFGGVHFAALGVGHVALDFLSVDANAGFVFLEEGVDSFGFDEELFRRGESFSGHFGFALAQAAVASLVLFHEGGGFLPELVTLAPEVGKGAAPLLGCVSGELEPVDGKVSAVEKTFLLADGQNIDENGFDVFAELFDELGYGGVVGSFTAEQSNEPDVVFAGIFDLAGGKNPL